MYASRTPELGKIVGDYREFIPRLPIETAQGRHGYLNDPYDEQIMALEDFRADGVDLVVHYKPRQVGDSTIKAADEYAYLFTTLDPVKSLVVTDHDDTTDALHRKYHYFNDNLPDLMKRRTRRSNRKELLFDDTLSGVRCTTAGSKAMGKGWTYQRVIAEEMAFWPNDEEVWASITATQHEGPHKKTFILSTANGPGNLYHKTVIEASRAALAGDPKVRFRFFRWSDHRKYKMEPPPGWEPTQDEHLLGEQFGLSWAQLYWRHRKIHGAGGIGEALFRRHYPLNFEDGFVEFDGMWFDITYLTEVQSSLSPIGGEVRVYEPPIRGMLYAAGVDASWCNGGDDAVLQILDQYGTQVLTFSTNQGGEERFGRMASELILRYNDAKVLIEDNPGGGGRNVRKILEMEGRKLWRRQTELGQRQPRVAKFWITTNDNKIEAYAHLRQMVNGDFLDLRDWQTVQQLMHVREDNGKLEGQDGMHDDMADALYMAEWCRKSLPGERSQMRSMRTKRKARRVAWRSESYAV